MLSLKTVIPMLLPQGIKLTTWNWTFFFFLPHCVSCRILVPWPEIEPSAWAVGEQSPNHWTAREVPKRFFLIPSQGQRLNRHPRSMSTRKRKESKESLERPLWHAASVISLSWRFQSFNLTIEMKDRHSHLRSETPCCLILYLYLKLQCIIRPRLVPVFASGSWMEC